MARKKWERWKLANGKSQAPSIVITPETQIVLDGFPRSGNSYLFALMAVTQSSELKMAHHLHSVAHIKESVRRRLPTVVIARDPREAVLSYLAFDSKVPLEDSLLDWISFYSQVLKLNTSAYVVAEFGEFIKDANPLIHKINQVFGLSLSGIKQEIHGKAAKVYLEQHSQKLYSMSHQSQPSRERNEFKETIRGELEKEPHKSLLVEAIQIFDDLIR